MSQVLITGATGLIGSRLVKAISERGDEVTALSRSKEKLVRLFSEASNIRIMPSNVCEPFDIGDAELIFHAASPISGAFISQFPVDVIQPNVFALRGLFEQIIKQREKTGINSRVVIFSSATVYGSATDSNICVSEEDTSNGDSLDNPNSAYSESKRMSEVLARAYVHQHNIDVVIVRPSWVYGPTAFTPNTALYSFINLALDRKDILLNKSRTAKRDNIYVDDVVAGLLAVSQKGITGESYNISSGGQAGNFAAIDEIAELIAKILNKERGAGIRVLYNEPNSQNRAPGVILNNHKLCKLKPDWKDNLVSLESGLRQIIYKMASHKL